MTAENKQSSQIATLDGYPFTGVGGGSQTGRLTAGMGAGGNIQQLEGTVTPVSGSTTGSYYQMVRVPSNAIIKQVEVAFQGTSITTFVADVTIGISDSTIDGTSPANQVVPSGLTTTANAYIANPAATTTGLTGAAALFTRGLILSSAVVGTVYDVTWGNTTNSGAGTGNGGTFTFANSQQPLWQAAGYASDPGGFFDIVLYETSTESLSAAVIMLRVRFIVPPG
jgi:hypothetical protein